MTSQTAQAPTSGERALRWAAVLFAAGWGVHLGDHLRRGMAASPHAIMVGGTIQGVFVVVAILLAVTSRRRAPQAAFVVGFGSAILFTYAHLLPSYFPAYRDRLRLRSAHQRDVALVGQCRRRDRHGHRVCDRRHSRAPPSVRRRLGGATAVTAGGPPMNTGTLFFDGACGMCTRSKDLLLSFDRTGDIHTEPLQSPGTAQRLGITPTSLLDSVRWLDSTGAVYSGAEAANAALSAAVGTRIPLVVYRIPRHPLHPRRRLPLGRGTPVQVPWDDAVLRIAPGRLLGAVAADEGRNRGTRSTTS